MKEIFIHAGPPKTGTSAIQNFLTTNPRILEKHSIYYPKHELDKNGISAGNGRRILKGTSPNGVSPEKLEQLLQDFNQSKCNTLLLSSEAFFNHMLEIGHTLPDATLIFYLRSPLSYMQSTYNQSVKRRGNTDKFEINTRKPDMSRLKKLEEFIDAFGTRRLRLRFYHHNCFFQNNIISDFFASLNIQLKSQPESKKINRSYSFEALEFKRKLNKLPLDNYTKHLLDRVLQTHSGTMDYSLLSESEFSRYRNIEIELLQQFFSKYSFDGSQQYLDVLKSEECPPYFEQKLSQPQFESIIDFLKSTSPALFTILYDACTKSSSQLPDQAILAWSKYKQPEVLKLYYTIIHGCKKAISNVYNKLN